jgi:hypothetical protein
MVSTALVLALLAQTTTRTPTGVNYPLIPTGGIILVLSGTCPDGYTEATELNGKILIGTLAVNKDVGTLGGFDIIVSGGGTKVPISNHFATVKVIFCKKL